MCLILRRFLCVLFLGLGLSTIWSAAHAGDIVFDRAYQGNLSGNTFTTTTALNADAGSIHFNDGSGQRAFNNTSGTLTYTIGGVPYSETGQLKSRYPNGSVRMDAVAFESSGGLFRMLILAGTYTSSSSYGGSSNGVLLKLNEYVDQTAPDPAQTTIAINGGSSASIGVGATATIVVTSKLSSGTAVSGATVTLTPSQNGIATVSPATATSDSNGLTTFTVTGASSGSTTYYGTSVSAGTTTQTASTVSLTVTGVRTAANSTASVPGGIAGSPTTIVITVKDGNNVVVTGAASGLAVTIGGTNAGASVGSITDNGNGTYSVSYTPALAGTDSVTIKLDSTNISGVPYSSVVTNPLSITTTTLPTPLISQAYSQTVATSGGTAPVAFAISAGSLPAGLSLNALTGAITGTPNTAGAYSFTVEATDTNNVQATQAYSGTIVVALAITTTTLPTPLISQSYNQTVATSGGTAPVAFAVSSGSLPAGLSLNASTGLISGTPTMAGAYNFTVQATDTNSVQASQAYSGTIIVTLAITTTSLPTPLLSQAYSQTVSTSNGTAPISFVISAGTLPAGLSLNTSTGVISGTPTTAGAYSFTVQATDANSVTDTQTYSGTIAGALAITTTSLPTPLLSQAYSQTVSTSGGTAPIGFAISAGTLPAGLSLNSSTGVISGTATTAGAYSFTVQATDANSVTATQAYSGTISSALAITTTSLPTPLLSQAYSQTVATTGGTAPIGFAISAGTLPAGLSLNSSTGIISGTATTAGAYSFTVQANDANSVTATQAYSGTISGSLAITTISLPTPLLSRAYSQTVLTSGGTAPISFAISAGNLPTGLSLNSSTGVISGTPTTAGAYSFTVQATDANTVTATQAYSGTISGALSITTISLPTPLLSQAFSQTVSTSGGTAPISFAVSAGTLPAGLGLNSSTGVISGTPTTAGTYSFTIKATDANSVTATQAYTGTISGALAITTTSLPTPLLSQAYSQTVSTSGGTAPISFAISSGSLPSGLSLNIATGAITGTPTTAGAYTFTVQATDANSVTATQAYSGTISGALVITTTSLPTPLLSQAYSQTVATSGGTAPVSFAISAGSLPLGLSLNTSTGVITGTATTPGAYRFTVQATDANSITATQAYSGTISAALAITTTSLPTPLISQTYTQAIMTTGGTAPISFAISSASLPPGMSLNTATGAITGTPNTAGAYTFTVQAIDSNNVTATQTYSGNISAALIITTTSLPVPVLKQPYGETISTTGGTAPVIFAISAGSLPPGLTLDTSTGVISGTPTTDGAYSFTVLVTDFNGVTATRIFTGAVLPLAPSASATVAFNSFDNAIALVTLQSGQSLTVVTAPAHGEVTIEGASAIYTPAASYIGADSFTYALTSGSTTSESAVVTITVSPPPPPTVASPDEQTIEGNDDTTTTTQVATFELQELVKGLYTDVQIVEYPKHGTVTLVSAQPTTQLALRSAKVAMAAASTGIPTRAVYVANPGYVGPDSFAYIAVGPGGQSAPATVSVQVVKPTPTAKPLTAKAMGGQVVTVDLTATAEGGPFTAARIVTSPASAVGTTRLINGGTADARTFVLEFTPKGAFTGDAVITYTLTNSSGESEPLSLTITLEARPDASADADIRGIADAQSQSARAFAGSQIDNFNRRLESLHGGSVNSGNGLTVTSGAGVSEQCGRDARNTGEREKCLEMQQAVPQTAGTDEGDDRPNGSPASHRAGIWTGGAISVGKRDASTGRAELSIESTGVSAGADIALGGNTNIGVGAGFGQQDTGVGKSGSGVTATNWAVVAYGSMRSANAGFIDAVVGVGGLDFDTRRFVTVSNAFAYGERSGKMRFGSLTSGFDGHGKGLVWSLYGRADALSIDLDGYTERGPALYSLAYEDRTIQSLQGVAGGRVEYGVLWRGVTFRPRARFEYTHEFLDADDETLNYADWLDGAEYHILGDGWSNDRIRLSAGTAIRLRDNWSLDIEAGSELAKGYMLNTMRVRAEHRF